MAIDVLVMPTPPPMVVNNLIRVALVATSTADGTQAPPSIAFAVDYVYGATLAQKTNAILAAARQAYVDWCTPRGITPLPANQMRVEIVGIT